MRNCHALKQILAQTRRHWDREQIHSSVRRAFHKALQCRTPALGAEVYASENEERVVFHTCKSRACPSCGHRATMQWQRERWAALPDLPYKGITFTMPNLLWPLFRQNRRLLRALPILAAKSIETLALTRYGVRVGVMAILHTFNGRLEFNSHVHTMVTSGGMSSSRDWVGRVYFDHDRLMVLWKDGVMQLLGSALRAGLLRPDTTVEDLEAMLTEQEQRRWIIKIQSFKSKEHFLRYAGRYVRRPPIAQHRIVEIGGQQVTFWAQDKRLGKRIQVRCSLEEFVDRWAQHLPDRYQHAIRAFGVFASRTSGQTSAMVFCLLRQKQKQLTRRRWADSINRDFGYDPLRDLNGNRMKWVRRVPPQPLA